MFPCESCEISKNTFSYKTPPMAVSFEGLSNILRKVADFIPATNLKTCYFAHQGLFWPFIAYGTRNNALFEK